MAEVRKLSTVQEVVAAPNDGVIAILESMLADARAGKIRSVMMVFDGEKPGSSGHAAAMEEATSLLVYELERLKLILMSLMAQADEYEVQEPG